MTPFFQVTIRSAECRLHRFPLNILKSDRSFVNQIQQGNRNYQVVKTIITLSNQVTTELLKIPTDG